MRLCRHPLARTHLDGCEAWVGDKGVAEGKRRRYPDNGGALSLVPLAFEAGGCPADEAVAFIRSWAHGANAGGDLEETALQLSGVWQHVSTLLKLGNAELLLSALR